MPAESIVHASTHFAKWVLGGLRSNTSSISACVAPFLTPHSNIADLRCSTFLRDKPA